MANFVEPFIVEAINEQVLQGHSIRKISGTVQIAKNTVERYKKLFLDQHTKPIFCQCGRPAFHRGWCSARLRESPARQAFLANWTPTRLPALIRIKSPRRLNLSYPFIPPENASGKGVDLILLVNGMVPRGLPEQLRGDVCQEIITAVLAGELLETDIPRQLKAYIRRVRGAQEATFLAVSLDTPRRDGKSWHDVLAAPEASVYEEAMS